LINQRDVIRMKIPYPSINDKLAVSAHMYICRRSASPEYEFVKCQTLKPYMLLNNTMRHYVDEDADINRNPFQHKTRIDCDKVFSTRTVEYDNSLLTPIRKDVCEDTFALIEQEIQADGFDEKALDEIKLVLINKFIKKIK